MTRSCHKDFSCKILLVDSKCGVLYFNLVLVYFWPSALGSPISGPVRIEDFDSGLQVVDTVVDVSHTALIPLGTFQCLQPARPQGSAVDHDQIFAIKKVSGYHLSSG